MKQQLDEKSIELEGFRNDYKSCIGKLIVTKPMRRNWELNAKD